MNLLKEYSLPNLASFYQSPLGLYTALKAKFGDQSPTLKEVHEFLSRQKSHFLHTPHVTPRVHRGETSRWYVNSSVGCLQADVAYLARWDDVISLVYTFSDIPRLSRSYLW